MSSSDPVSYVIIHHNVNLMWRRSRNFCALILSPSSPLLSWLLRASCRSLAPSLRGWRQRPFWPWHLTGCCHLYPPWPNTHQASAQHKPMLSPPNYGYNTHTRNLIKRLIKRCMQLGFVRVKEKKENWNDKHNTMQNWVLKYIILLLKDYCFVFYCCLLFVSSYSFLTRAFQKWSVG